MQQAASDKLQGEIAKLEEEEQEAANKITELQRTKTDASQKFILSPEQQAELEKLRETRANTRKKLDELRKELRKDIDLLEARIMAANIGLMPLLVILIGIGVALLRRQRRASHQKKG